MKKCSVCGENITSWGRNIPCKPADAPLWEDHLPDQPELSAIARGFSPGDVVRNSHGHVGIVTYANYKWGDIRVRLRGKRAEEYPTAAMGWRIVKKASPEQAQRWLAEEALRAKDEFRFNHYFRIDPVTNETIHLHEENRPWNASNISGKPRPLSVEMNSLIQEICSKEFWDKNYLTKNSYKEIDMNFLLSKDIKFIKFNKTY